jgi:hypothetical protein
MEAAFSVTPCGLSRVANSSYVMGDKEAAKRADELLDCFVYGVALSLGNAEGF